MDEINMKEQVKVRVLAVMEQKQLSDAQFAEAIGISRGAVSQIKSGRSYPSLDVALKILDRYPDLSSDWLLLGKGEMYRSDELSNPMIKPALTAENASECSSVAENGLNYEVGNPQNVTQPTVVERIVYKDLSAKTISKIVVFYSDNTFDTFVLEKKED